MASQPPQRPRRNASPRSGPMRAIVPFSLRQNNSPTRGTSNNGRRTSPGPILNSSDNHKVKHHTHRSSDQRASPERSPSSPGFKVEKPKPVRASPGPAIRRTSSLDTITAPYLSGHWPKEPASSSTSHGSSTNSSSNSNGAYEPNQMHQSTQTEDADKQGSSHKRSSSLGSADNLKEKYRQQLRKQGSRQSSSTNQRASPVHGYHSYQQAPPSPSPGVYSARSSAISIPTSTLKPPSPKILRGSLEGLNQEIEKLVLNSGFDLEDERIGEIDGHRAPIPGTSKRSVDTQTPRESQEDSPSDGSSQSPSSPSDRSRPSSGSSSAGNGDSKEVKEVPDGSPELTWGARISSSPSHNKSWQLTRDPPDGCEKVKTMDDPSPKHQSLHPAPITQHCPDKMLYIPLKPSDSSAFCPLPNFPLGDFKGFSIPITTAVAQTQTHSEEQS